MFFIWISWMSAGEFYLFIYTLEVGEGALKLGYNVPTLSVQNEFDVGKVKGPIFSYPFFLGFGFPSLSLILVWTLRASLVDIHHLHCLPVCPKELNAGQDSQKPFTLASLTIIKFNSSGHMTANYHNIFITAKMPISHRSKEN